MTYPTRKITREDASPETLGSQENCNVRTINKYLHPAVLPTCQLLMGLTELAPGSLWNTMPCHTHERRMEVYLYFNMKDDNIVFHYMGEPQETRHIVMRNEQAVISLVGQFTQALAQRLTPLFGAWWERTKPSMTWTTSQ